MFCAINFLVPWNSSIDNLVAVLVISFVNLLPKTISFLVDPNNWVHWNVESWLNEKFILVWLELYFWHIYSWCRSNFFIKVYSFQATLSARLWCWSLLIIWLHTTITNLNLMRLRVSWLRWKLLILILVRWSMIW